MMGLLPNDIELLPPYDERERAIFRNRRIAMADKESNMITAVRNAEKSKALDIAKNALQMNMPIDVIINLTGLNREEIEKLCDAD